MTMSAFRQWGAAVCDVIVGACIVYFVVSNMLDLLSKGKDDPNDELRNKRSRR